MSLYVHTIADREKFKVAKYACISDFPIKYFLLLYVADYHLFLSNTISFCKIMVISMPFNWFLSVTICIYIYTYMDTMATYRGEQTFTNVRSIAIGEHF